MISRRKCTTAAHLLHIVNDPVTRQIGSTNHPRRVRDDLTGGQHMALDEFPNHGITDAKLRGGAVHRQPAIDGRLRGIMPSVDTSNPATDRHRKTGHHAGELRLVSGLR